MQQFVVPQFIDNEDKILGPITVRQFIIVMVTALILVILYRFLDFTGFILGVLVFGGFGAMLAFVKVNGRAFHYFILNVMQITLRPALRVWKQEVMMHKDADADNEKKDERVTVPKLVKPSQVSNSRLSELSLLVDTGGEYRPDSAVFSQPANGQ